MLFKHFNKATTEFYNKILIARINLNYFKLGHLRLPDKTVTKELRNKEIPIKTLPPKSNDIINFKSSRNLSKHLMCVCNTYKRKNVSEPMKYYTLRRCKMTLKPPIRYARRFVTEQTKVTR